MPSPPFQSDHTTHTVTPPPPSRHRKRTPSPERRPWVLLCGVPRILAGEGERVKDVALALENRLHRPRRDDDFAWAYDGVVAHDGRLWWVDLS